MKKVLLFFLLIFSLFLFIPNSLASYSSGAINIDLTINKIKDFLFNKKEIQIPEKPQIKVQDKISR
jgi:hypothetical protein